MGCLPAGPGPARGPRGRRDAVADGTRHPRERHHLQRLRRPQGRRPALGGRSAAAAAVGRRVATHRGRHRPARRPAEPGAGRHLRPAAAAAQRGHSAGGDLRPQRFPAPGAAHPSAGRRAPVPLRRRPGALAGRPLVGGQRPHPGAFGRRLRAGEPPGGVAGLSADVPRPACAAPGVVLRRHARVAAALGAQGGWSAADRAADPRPLQRDLFRACAAGALPGLPAGRGQ